MKALLVILIFSMLPHFTLAADFKANLGKGRKNLIIKVGKYSETIKLSIPKGMKVEGTPSVYGQTDFYVVITELADFESATTLIHAFNSKGRLLWSKDLKAFNPSTPLIEKDFVYLATIGKVWKVNKKTGQVKWFQDGLYEAYQFNGKEKIIREKNLIQFAENVWVNDQTGKIKQVTQ